ncbi:MAG TPA: hypothetical protein VKG80_07315 [Trebonia sp.]|nr:hypothetical protein [Trebonia sp.]
MSGVLNGTSHRALVASRMHSRRQMVASQPLSLSASLSWWMCSRQRSQVSWTASPASSADSPHWRASHRSSGSYRSRMARHAASSPARIPATSSSWLKADADVSAVFEFIVVLRRACWARIALVFLAAWFDNGRWMLTVR